MSDLLAGLEEDVARQTATVDDREARLEGSDPKKGRGRVETPVETKPEEGPSLYKDPSYYEALTATERIMGDDLTPESAAALRAELARVNPTLTQKVVRVMAAIDAVEKKGRNEAQRYSYQRATDVAAAVRKEFVKENVILTLDITDTSTTILPRADGKSPMILSEVKGRFRLTDGVESFEFGGAGMGMDAGDKGIYKAITGMLKYGLRALLLLPDEKDDPEVAREDEKERPIVIEGSTVEGVRQGGRQTHATTAQVNEIKRLAGELVMAPEALAAFIVSELGEGPDIDDLAPPDQAKAILAHLSGLSFADCGKIVKSLMHAVEVANGVAEGGE